MPCGRARNSCKPAWRSPSATCQERVAPWTAHRLCSSAPGPTTGTIANSLGRRDLVDLAYGRAILLLAEGKPVEAEKHLRTGVAAVERNVVDNQERLRANSATVDQYLVEFSRCLMLAALAEALDAQSRFVEAEFEMRRAVTCELRSVGSQAAFSALMLGKLAQLFYRKGRYEDARRVAAAAVQIYEHNQASPRATPLLTARRILAASLTALQRWDEAQAEFDCLEQDFLSDPTLAKQSWLGDPDWVLCCCIPVRSAKRSVCSSCIRKRLCSYLARSTTTNPAEARGFYAIALVRDGQSAAAFEQFRAALPVLLRDPGEQQRSAVRVARLARIIEAYISPPHHLRLGYRYNWSRSQATATSSCPCWHWPAGGAAGTGEQRCPIAPGR